MSAIGFDAIFAALKERLNLDAKTAPVPFLGQIASAVEDAEDVRLYNQQLEAALVTPGVAYVAIVAEGEPAPAAMATQSLTLWNRVALAVVENPATNATGLTAVQHVHRLLRLLQHAQWAQVKTAREDIKLDNPAFNVGPLSHGSVVYFVNCLVRTSEPLGPVEPVNP